MAITGTSVDYSNRLVDLSLYPNISTSGVSVVGNADTSRAIAGISKVAQNFSRILLTPLGKYRAYPLLGSNLMARIKGGFVNYDADLLHLFSGESMNVINFMNSTAPVDAPADELVYETTLSSYSAARGRFNLEIQLSTFANTDIKFLLPVIWNN